MNIFIAILLLIDLIACSMLCKQLIIEPSRFVLFTSTGNVAYDPVSSRLILTTDSPHGEATNSSEPLIPYVPYPINPHTGQPVESHLTPLEKRSDMRLNGSMTDPVKGIPVPILGMTIHPVTGKYIAFI